MELDGELKVKVDNYQPSEQNLDTIRKLPLIFMVGITSAGKNTVLARLLQHDPDHFEQVISHTTRAPRMNSGVQEINGREYYFVDCDQMSKMIADNGFVEVKNIHNIQISGTSFEELRRISTDGKIGVGDIDVNGIDEYLELGLNVKPIFILPPSYNVWMGRLRLRYGGKVHMHDLYMRMQSALQEIEHAMLSSDYYIVVNDDLDKTADLVIKIACSETVDPHEHHAVEVAEELMSRIRAELAKMT